MEASNLRPHTKHTHIILLWNIRKYKPNIHATDSDTQTHTHTRGNQVQKHFSLQMNLLIIMKKKLQKITKKKDFKICFSNPIFSISPLCLLLYFVISPIIFIVSLSKMYSHIWPLFPPPPKRSVSFGKWSPNSALSCHNN